MAPPGQATLPMLHRFLGIGVALLAVVAGVLRYLGLVPLLNDAPDAARVVGFAFAGLTVAMLFAVFFVFKPRVPERGGGQRVADYWTTPESASPVLLVWFVNEGAGVFSVIGYMLTGEPVVALTAAIAIAAFWLLGPNAFAKP